MDTARDRIEWWGKENYATLLGEDFGPLDPYISTPSYAKLNATEAIFTWDVYITLLDEFDSGRKHVPKNMYWTNLNKFLSEHSDRAIEPPVLDPFTDLEESW